MEIENTPINTQPAQLSQSSQSSQSAQLAQTSESMQSVQTAQPARSDKHTRLTCYFTMIIAACSVMTFVVILVVALAVVPKALSLMDTAQRTLNNLETVSEELKSLELTETIKSIEDNTTSAMQDVSASMEQLRQLDMDSLNQSIQDLGESVSEFRSLFGA